MNATLILIPLAGLGLTGTLVLRGVQGEACRQQAACAAAKAAPITAPAPPAQPAAVPAAVPVAEPSVAARSLVRYLGGEQVSTAAQTTQAGPAAGLVSVGQVGQGAVAAGAALPRASEPAAGAVACETAVTQGVPAQELEARRMAELGYMRAQQAEQSARQSRDYAFLRAKEAELAAAQAERNQRSRVYTDLATVQAGQARAGEVDAYTRSLERRIEALERRLAERDHAAATPGTPAPPPSVYNARPGSGARIVNTPPAGGGAERWDVLEVPEPPEPEMPEVVELEDYAEGVSELGGVVVLTPDGRTRYPVAVAAPRAPLAPQTRTPVAPRAPEPDAPSAFGSLRGMHAPGGGGSGGDLSELTRLIEEMRAQVGELQRDLESLREDLTRVRTSRNSGAR